MSITRYRAVLARPGVTRLVLFAVFARIPQTATGVVLTLHVVSSLHLGYAAAGAVTTATTVGMALGGPWRGRAVDRLGLRRALLPSILGAGLTWGVAPFVGFVPLIGVAFLGGLIGVPIFTVARQSLSVLVPPDHLRAAFALDSVGVELSFMVGPAAGVLLATQLSTTAALLTVGACAVASGVGLAMVNPPTRSAGDGSAEPQAREAREAREANEASEASEARLGDAGHRPAGGSRQRLTPSLMAVLGAALAAGVVLSGSDVGVVAHLRAHDALSLTGLVFLAWSGGSIIGGLVYGAAHRAVSPLVLLLCLAVLTIPVGLAPSAWLIAVTILPAAALCAPVISATVEAVTRSAAEDARGEAMGLHGSALTIGTAMGAPLAGVAIDAAGPWAGFVTVGAVGALLAVAGLVGQVALRGRARRGAVTPSPAPVEAPVEAPSEPATGVTLRDVTCPDVSW